MNTPWKFFTSTKAALDGMYEACAAATSSIDCEQFIFENDSEGERFAELFIKKAGEGVKVRLLADTAGSYYFYNSAWPRKLQKAGVQVRFFNEISPWRITRVPIWLNRNHRKLLVVDRKVAVTGGVGISTYMHSWRDTNLLLQGPVVDELQAAFDHMWWMVGRDRFMRSKTPRQTVDGFTVVTNAPHFRQRFIHQTAIEAIRQARDYIYITTPYFVPDHRFMRVLRLARKRGVEVKLLVPSASDHPYVDYASNFYFRSALKTGIEIYRYEPGMIHAKTMVIDGVWASVGSANVDNLSSYFNHELNIVANNRKFAEEIRQHFITDLIHSHEVLPEVWEKRSFAHKCMETISAPFGRFF